MAGLSTVLLANHEMPYSELDSSRHFLYKTEKDIKVKNFFKAMDDICRKYADSIHYPLTEYHLVNFNPWIIDSLNHTSYYWLKELGIKDLNQKERVVIKKGDIINIPDKNEAEAINDRLKSNKILINIPEYKLRIFHEDLLIHSSLIRVGRNESKYLKSIEKYVDLRTRTGKGIVYYTERNPTWINPANGEKYFETKRDDGVVTKMSITPSITFLLNGYVSGQLIHATTNPETLGRAYSNGCIGTAENEIWTIYYYCPPGTKVEIIYDRKYARTDGEEFPDIYDNKHHKKK